MKALVIGAQGFVGGYMVRHLRERGFDVVGTSRRNWAGAQPLADGVPLESCDLSTRADLDRILAELKPDHIYHLAGVTHTPESWKDPERTIQINVIGTLHLLEAVRLHSPDSRVLLVSTADVYGATTPGRPSCEDDACNPTSPYGVSKVAAELMGGAWARTYGIFVVRVRPLNHTGPGQRPNFVLPGFARSIALAEAGRGPSTLTVGNLDVVRDFMDVRDVVAAYLLGLQHGVSGDCYNVASGRPVTILTALDILRGLARVPTEVVVDPARIRPGEAKRVDCDISRFQQLTGWSASINLEKTLEDLLNFWRRETASANDTASHHP